WRIMQNDDLLISQCLKVRNFSRSNFLKVSTGYCPSYTWRSILPAQVDVRKLPISDVHLTPLFSGFYKLNVDVARPIKGDKWGISVVVRDNEGVVVGASSWQVFLLPNSADT
ncbi:hypothetical protein MTR_0524s0030, partial [Medicago truncatula]